MSIRPCMVANVTRDRAQFDNRIARSPCTISCADVFSICERKERTMPAQNTPGIVFAHGLWADGSCFQKLIPTLQADGHEVICSQHVLDSLRRYVDCVTRCFGRVSGPVVLVGHSYGGTLITHAGIDNRVAALVYLAALAPDETETSQSLQQKFPATEIF